MNFREPQYTEGYKPVGDLAVLDFYINNMEPSKDWNNWLAEAQFIRATKYDKENGKVNSRAKRTKTSVQMWCC